MPDIVRSISAGMLIKEKATCARNFVYIAYTENRGNMKTSTSIAKAYFNKKKLDFKNIFQAEPPINSGYHFGSRLAIKDNYLFASAGERAGV